ncbi:MAG: hypothetical protein N4A49_05435 [Marinifilaceae bacterium]|jgi:hypothetical protein|nr:hypothetical protein [Marinifilaceae bacterium]
MTNSNHIQELTLSTDKWKVDLVYENWHSETKTLEAKEGDFVIELSEKGEWHSILKIDITDEKRKRTCILTGIQGSTYLQKSNTDENGKSVKIDSDNLTLSLGLNFVSIDLNKLNLNWKIEPNMAEVFEFYDLENDYLLRGEVGIHRIDKSGQVKWTFSAADIWVNMEGRAEVEITENSIKLLDFNSDEYEIDFDGKEIKNYPQSSRPTHQ